MKVLCLSRFALGNDEDAAEGSVALGVLQVSLGWEKSFLPSRTPQGVSLSDPTTQTCVCTSAKADPFSFIDQGDLQLKV